LRKLPNINMALSIPTTKIPLPYRIIFFIIDIAGPLIGITLNIFNPVSTLEQYTAHPQDPPNLETLVAIDCSSGFFATLAFLNIFFLLYRPNDILVWRALTGSVILQDLFMIGGFARELNLRGGEWRGQDYGNVLGYSAIVAVRALFVLGVGIGERRGGSKKEL